MAQAASGNAPACSSACWTQRLLGVLGFKGFGFQVVGFKVWVLGFRFLGSSFRFLDSGLGFWVQGFRFEGLGLRGLGGVVSHYTFWGEEDLARVFSQKLDMTSYLQVGWLGRAVENPTLNPQP